MNQIQNFLDKEIIDCENALEFTTISLEDKRYVNARLKTLKDVLRILNSSAPELHICPGCAADLAYIKIPNGNCKQDSNKFELKFIRNNC